MCRGILIFVDFDYVMVALPDDVFVLVVLDGAILAEP
jgi:hypothetical protein